MVEISPVGGLRKAMIWAAPRRAGLARPGMGPLPRVWHAACFTLPAPARRRPETPGATTTEYAAMQTAPTAPQAIRAFRMQSQQDAARLQAAGGGQDFAATLQGLRPGPTRIAGPGTPTGNTLAALLQRLDTDQDGRITPLELRASTDRQGPPEAARAITTG
jgi:hypothetical protein